MPLRVFVTPASFARTAALCAAVLCLAAPWACAPARPAPAGPLAGSAAGNATQTPFSDRLRRLALAAYHLKDGRGGGPLEALKLLDAAPEGGGGRGGAPGGVPADPEAGELALRALAFRQLGRNAEAVDALDRLLLARRDLPPGALADVFVERGLALAGLGRQARAAEDYAAALALAPRHVPALMARADQSFALDRPAEAEAGYGKILEIEPANVLALINRGVARDEQGRFQEAVADFTQALALAPDSAAAHANRGVSRSQAGDMAGMCEDYRAACRLGACRRLESARGQGYCRENP